MKKFDWIVIGGGSGGLSVVEKVTEFKKSCLLIDSNPLGGTCVNVGCVPKKMMWYLSEVYEKSKLVTDYCIDDKTRSNNFLFSKFVNERQKIIANINQWYEQNLNKERVMYMKGKAHFKSPHTVQVGNELFWGEKIAITTGSKAYFPKDIEGSELGITSDGFFELKEIPKSICIVGSGYIALELAAILSTLQEIQYHNVDTTVLIRSNQILKKIDNETTQFLKKELEKKGIQFYFNENVKRVEKKTHYLSIELNSNKKLEKNCLIWATGRKPNSDKLMLEKTNIKTNKLGYIETDDFFETDQPNHYALGDVIDKPQLTPVAIQCGRRLIKQLYEKKEENKVLFDFVPTAIFTHPPLSTIGLSQEQAKERGIEVDIYTSSFTPMIYNFSSQSQDTFIKLICEKKSQKVIGLHMVGEMVDEILQGFSVAISMGATKKDFDKTFAIHPTSAEEVVTLKPMI